MSWLRPRYRRHAQGVHGIGGDLGAAAHRRRLRHAQAASDRYRGSAGDRHSRYERASTLLTSNRPVEDWGKLLGDVAAVTAMPSIVYSIMGIVLKCGPRSWRAPRAAVTAAGATLPRFWFSGLCRQRSVAHPARDICTCGPVKTKTKTKTKQGKTFLWKGRKPKPLPRPSVGLERATVRLRKRI